MSSADSELPSPAPGTSLGSPPGEHPGLHPRPAALEATTPETYLAINPDDLLRR